LQPPVVGGSNLQHLITNVTICWQNMQVIFIKGDKLPEFNTLAGFGQWKVLIFISFGGVRTED
jgi:hypothetical protein